MSQQLITFIMNNPTHALLVEHAEARLRDYRAAFDALVSAHINLLGACHAADEYRNRLKLPPTMTGPLGHLHLVLPLPLLPSVTDAAPRLSTLSSFDQFTEAKRLCAEVLQHAQRSE